VPRHSETILAAIKQAVDIVALAGQYREVHRHGSKSRILCPFHDDHKPSLDLNPERQSFKCWACGAYGDIFDLVRVFERVEFPEATRMLAERAGIALDTPADRSDGPEGLSKSDLLAVMDWAQKRFAAALGASDEARAYVAERGITAESVTRFGLGLAPDERDWLQRRAVRDGQDPALLEPAGLIARNADNPLTRDKFRGRLMFPIRDFGGRTIAFGGRLLPATEQRLTRDGLSAPKYLNSPETRLFQKSRVLYAADLAREAARTEGWVAVVEGYTDAIAAHQAGLANVVGTMGTAFGDEHIQSLRRLAEKVVLLFDGDEAGQNAADKALVLFLAHELDVRILTLPEGLDPAEFLQARGAEAFRELVQHSVDPLDFAINRAAARFDFASPEGARQAAEWVLAILARMPKARSNTVDLKVGKALSSLGSRLRLPVADLQRRLRQLVRPIRKVTETPQAYTPIRAAELDPLDRELVEIVLNEPATVALVVTVIPVASLRDTSLRAILEACYDVYREGELPSYDRVASRLDDPAIRALAAEARAADPLPLPNGMDPPPPDVRLKHLLQRIAERQRNDRLRQLDAALAETDSNTEPQEHEKLRLERLRLTLQRPLACGRGH
jgi:DNA primase